MSDKLDIWNNPRITSRHIAALGKTGSGKTSTAKLLIEHVVREQGARVCIIDPLKSDWWGITSSRNGKEPGLPFHILGGPHKHVALHAAAGAAIGSVVASGALKHAIIDMADFDQGGPENFWAAFAKTLFHQIKGVVYLVVEEAHVFAPKEKFGFGGESQSIYWMKRIATAARTKGIRLIVCTQRTQELHNAVLGSCDTIIAHRMTAPADQKPVIDWLKANASKETTAEVAASLASLADGEAWVCAGEAQITQRHRFPKITTYDNTKTPDHDEADHKIKTASVDLPKLMSIIGESVEQAKANDPKELRSQIAALKRELAEASKDRTAPAAKEKVVEKPVMKDSHAKALVTACETALAGTNALEKGAQAAVAKFQAEVARFWQEFERRWKPLPEIFGLLKSLQTAAPGMSTAPLCRRSGVNAEASRPADQFRDTTKKVDRPAGDGSITGIKSEILDAIAWWNALGLAHPRRVQVGFVCGKSASGGYFSRQIGELKTDGLIEYPSDGCLALTPAGNAVATPPVSQPTIEQAQQLARNLLSGVHLHIYDAVLHHGRMTRERLAEITGKSDGGGYFSRAIGELKTAGLIQYPAKNEVDLTELLR